MHMEACGMRMEAMGAGSATPGCTAARRSLLCSFAVYVLAAMNMAVEGRQKLAMACLPPNPIGPQTIP